jgi:hypothetical protein
MRVLLQELRRDSAEKRLPKSLPLGKALSMISTVHR